MVWWYGFNSRVRVSCACFVSWCANECGYIDSGVIPKVARLCQWGCSGSRTVDNGRDGGSFEPSAGPGDHFSSIGTTRVYPARRTGSPTGVGTEKMRKRHCLQSITPGDSRRQRQYPVGYYENSRLRYSGIDEKEHKNPYMMAFVHFFLARTQPLPRGSKTRAVLLHPPAYSGRITLIVVNSRPCAERTQCCIFPCISPCCHKSVQRPTAVRGLFSNVCR